jgi:hypothetical protein
MKPMVMRSIAEYSDRGFRYEKHREDVSPECSLELFRLDVLY